jgi:hypothetical protein
MASAGLTPPQRLLSVTDDPAAALRYPSIGAAALRGLWRADEFVFRASSSGCVLPDAWMRPAVDLDSAGHLHAEIAFSDSRTSAHACTVDSFCNQAT